MASPIHPDPNRGAPLDYAAPAKPAFLGLTRDRLRIIGRISKFTLKWCALTLFAFILLLALAVGFGTSAADAEKMRAFARAVERWQHNPDFRAVQVEYVEVGSESMRTKLAFVNSTKAVMFLRSLPGLPPHLRVNDTSLQHYTNFTRGPLSAYLHLTGETAGGMVHAPGMLKYTARVPDPSDEIIRHDFILQHKFENYTVASDHGACEGIRHLINDVDISREFKIPKDVPQAYIPYIQTIAKRFNFPTQVEQMNPQQQSLVREALDTELREHDYELWRTKQLNDCQNGIWAQVYGTMYSAVIEPILRIRDISRIAAPIVLAGWIALALRRRKALAQQGDSALSLDAPQEMPEST